VASLVTAAFCFGRGAVHALGGRLVEATAGLHSLAGLIASTGERSVQLNGAELAFASGRSSLSLAAWRAEAVASCSGAEGSGSSRAASARGWATELHSATAAVVGCLRDSRWPTTHEAALALVAGLAKDLDVSRLGRFELLRAEATAGSLHVSRVYAPGALPLRAMFPRQGDAPGIDLPMVPRVGGARRRLSAFERGGAPMVVAYSRAGAVEALAAEQASLLSAAGYRELAQRGAEATRAFARGAELLLMRTHPQAGEGALILFSLGLGPLRVVAAEPVR
jgi:hypothetical protein